jgi:hypothetical protein
LAAFGHTKMHFLRWLFLLVCLGCVALVGINGRWEGWLTGPNCAWTVDLDRAPIWAPPPEPVYATFQKDFNESETFPPQGAPGLTIKRVLRVDRMAFDLLLSLWLATVICGVLYLATRGRRRDLVLHVGLFVGIGLTAGAITCVGLWLVFGGWGPPSPGFFGSLGLFGGIVGGLVSFRRESAEPRNAADSR